MPAQTNGFSILSLFKMLILLSLVFLNSSAPALGTEGWQPLGAGIEYRDLEGGFLTPWSHIHVFRVNLEKNKLSLITANSFAQKSASIQEYAQFSHALLAINGGFFDQEFKPLGLRISNGRQISPLKPISWWGIFYTQGQKAYLKSIKQFYAGRSTNFAIQSGPRLLVNGQIPSLKPGSAERSALGITKDGRVIILVTDNAALTTTELAQLMKAPPLNCTDALNLDGGSSSQLQASIQSFNLSVHGFSTISDAVVVTPRK